jgi:hypothetical protein
MASLQNLRSPLFRPRARLSGWYLSFCFGLTSLAGGGAHGQSFWERTQLIDVRDDNSLSATAGSLGRGGYTLSDGSPVLLRDWYSSDWKDISFTFLTEVSRNFGVYWGFSTGERGDKYEIEPGLKIGFIYLAEVSDRGTISLSATGIVGGYLREGTCQADYGDIGGVQQVNCRLAATVLQPSDTLDYLARESPADQIRINLLYSFRF